MTKFKNKLLYLNSKLLKFFFPQRFIFDSLLFLFNFVHGVKAGIEIRDLKTVLFYSTKIPWNLKFSVFFHYNLNENKNFQWEHLQSSPVNLLLCEGRLKILYELLKLNIEINLTIAG